MYNNKCIRFAIYAYLRYSGRIYAVHTCGPKGWIKIFEDFPFSIFDCSSVLCDPKIYRSFPGADPVRASEEEVVRLIGVMPPAQAAAGSAKRLDWLASELSHWQTDSDNQGGQFGMIWTTLKPRGKNYRKFYRSKDPWTFEFTKFGNRWGSDSKRKRLGSLKVSRCIQMRPPLSKVANGVCMCVCVFVVFFGNPFLVRDRKGNFLFSLDEQNDWIDWRRGISDWLTAYRLTYRLGC